MTEKIKKSSNDIDVEYLHLDGDCNKENENDLDVIKRTCNIKIVLI